MLNSTVNRSPVASPTSLLVLEPPRLTNLPLVFLTAGRHLVGSADDCAIRIPVEGVQSRHVMILVGDQLTIVKALDERTWVNDYPASETRLRSGDRLSIGPITYRVRSANQNELEDLALRQQEISTSPRINSLADRVALPAGTRPDAQTIDRTGQAATLTVNSIDQVHGIGDVAVQPFLTPDGLIDLLTDTIASEVTSSTGLLVTSEAAIEPAINGLREFPPVATVPTVDAIQASAAELAAEQARQSALWQEREAAHQRLSDELQAQRNLSEQQQVRLQVEADRLADERAELQRLKARLEIDAIQASAVKLASEESRHSALWQERKTAHQRISDDLQTQWDLAEQQQARLQVEADRLAGERAELQRLKSEFDLERRATVDARASISDDTQAFQREQASFAADRQQHLEAVRANNVQLEIDRQVHADAHAELIEIRRTLEQERTQFAADRTAESVRREQDIREQTASRRRIHETEASLQTMRLHQDSVRTSLEDERRLIESASNELERRQSQLDQRQSQIELAQTESQNRQESVDKQQRELTSRERELATERHALNQQQRTVEAQQVHLEEWQSRLQNEQQALAANRSELDALQDSLRAERDEIHRHCSSMNSNATPVTIAPDPSSTTFFSNDLAGRDPTGSVDQPPLPSDSRVTASQGIAPAPISMGNWILQPRSELRTLSEFDGSPRSHLPDADQSTAAESSSARVVLRPRSEFGETVVELSSSGATEQNEDLGDEPVTSEMIMVTEPESIEQTLTDVSERFGFGPQISDLINTSADLPANVPSLLLGSAVEHDAESIESSEKSHETSAMTTAVSASETSEEGSLSSLRAQLAQMFDLTNEGETDHAVAAEIDDTETAHQLPANVPTMSPLDELDASNAPASGELPGESSSSPIDSTETVTVLTLPAAEPQPAAPIPAAPSAPAAEGESEEENAWSRRLRELSAVAQAAEAPKAALPNPTPVVEEPKQSEADDEYSIEAQLARLLGRSKATRSEPTEAPTAVEKRTTEAAADAPPSDEILTTNELSEADDEPTRSHLQEGPRHKQNKSAVREEVQSFRAVAQMSARTAIAKHSKNTLKSSFYFASGLTLAAAGATAWFLGTYFAGTEPHIWKGLACVMAAAASGERLLRFSSQLREPQNYSKTRSVARKHAVDEAK